MRIALVSDIHIHDWSEFRVVDNNGMPSRLLHGVRVLTDVRQYCLEHGIFTVVIAGDVFHKRNVIYTRPYHLVIQELQAFKHDRIAVYALSGNHDQADKEGTISTIDTFAEAGLVDAVSSRKGWRVWACDGVDIAAFNFCDDRARLMRRVDKALATVDASHVVGVFHHGFKGARTGSSLEYVVKEDIDVTPFARSFDFVFSGHYHGRQIIDKRNNTMYIGSPMQHVRGEDANKGFLVYDSETRTVTPVALDRPQFVSITQEELSSAKAGVERIVRGNFVDLHYERWDASFSTQLQQLGAVGVKLLPTKRQVEMKKRLNIDPSLSASKVIKRYVAYKKNSLKGVDRKALLRVGLDLYNKGSE